MDEHARQDFASEFEGFVDLVTLGDRPEIQRIAREVALDAADVAADGGEDMDEIAAQLRLMLEEHRIEVVAGGWEIVGSALRLFLSGARLFG